MSDDNVVSFRKDVPSARLKRLDWNDKRATCRHRCIEVWVKEPIIECSDCGAVVDPFAWIRDLTNEWEEVDRRRDQLRQDAEREMAEIKKQLRMLRGDLRDEKERREAERAVMVLPPRRTLGT
jgi:hypothetical protein